MSHIPAGWTKTRIGALCNLVNGRAFKPTDWTDDGLPIVRIQNLNNRDAPFNHFKGEVNPRFLLYGGELLFAWSGTPGTSFGAHVWYGGKAVLNQHIFRVEFDENLMDKRFFRYAINQTLDELISIAHGGVGLRHVTKGKFENTEVLVPPLVEQQRIADKLDALLARVDACRARLGRVPALLKRFRQAVLAAAVAGRLTEDWDESPDGWYRCQLGSVLTDVRYGTAQRSEYGLQDGIPVLRIPNIGEGRIDPTDLKYGRFSQKEIQTLALKQGDLLLVRSNGSVELVGKAAVVERHYEGYLFAGYLIRLRVDVARISPHYLCLCLSSPTVRDYIELTARSTSGVNNINSDEIRSIQLTLPSLPLQHEIIRRVETLFAYADRLEARLAAAQTRVAQLTPSLLGKAFRGELGTTTADEERNG